MYQSSRRQSYVIVDTVLPQAFYTPYLSSTPQVLWEVIKRSATNRRHRNLTSPGYSAGSAVWLLKYHYPLRLSSPSVGSNPTSFKVSFNRSLQRGDLRAPFELGLLAHHELTQVTCLMNGYSVFQRSLVGRVFIFPPQLVANEKASKGQQNQKFLKNIFIFFNLCLKVR